MPSQSDDHRVHPDADVINDTLETPHDDMLAAARRHLDRSITTKFTPDQDVHAMRAIAAALIALVEQLRTQNR